MKISKTLKHNPYSHVGEFEKIKKTEKDLGYYYVF